VLWHFVKDNVRYPLIKRGVLAGAAQRVAEVRAEFEKNAAQGQFKELFFDAYDINLVLWCDTFSRSFKRADPVRILEIGSWEGRSTLFLLTYFTEGHLTAVDTWAGGDEHQDNAERDLSELESQFDANLTSFAKRLTKRKGLSQQVLPQLLDEEQKFDVIYVDGSHFADDVLTDGINAWRLLKKGGILIFDDLLWACYPRARANPAWAIKLFLKYFRGEYTILNAYSQIVLRKHAIFTDHVTSEVAGLQFSSATGETH
jgi:predicted O-methyltransferase YrrM